MGSPADITRRAALKQAGVLAVALGALEAAESLAVVPQRALAAASPPDIQFDISAFLAVPPQTYGSGVRFQMPPVHTTFLTAVLERTPTRADQAEMHRVLRVLERFYPWGAAHLVTFVAYGLPYFDRLPGGPQGRLVSRHMPRLLSDTSRYVLEEAVPGPTDVSPANPGITSGVTTSTWSSSATTCCSRCVVTVRRSWPTCWPGSSAATSYAGARSPRRLGRVGDVHLEPADVRADGHAEGDRAAE